MIRSRHFRSFMAILLAFCLVSASLWSVSAEAMADALADEASHFSVGSSGTDRSSADKACNHGCHAQTQLAGLDRGVTPFFLPVSAQIHWANASPVIPSRPADSPFRPPRGTFQV
jgi:hypothetical protein